MTGVSARLERITQSPHAGNVDSELQNLVSQNLVSNGRDIIAGGLPSTRLGGVDGTFRPTNFIGNHTFDVAQTLSSLVLGMSGKCV